MNSLGTLRKLNGPDIDEQAIIKETAYHEAGHVVAHFRLGVDQDRVTIKPHDDNLGSVCAEGKDHVWDVDQAEAQVICYCSGYAALIAVGHPEEVALQGSDDDMENASELIDKWGLSGTLNKWRSTSVGMMCKPENVRAVDFVAKALLRHETLDGEYVETLIELADGDITTEEWQQYLSWREMSEQQCGTCK